MPAAVWSHKQFIAERGGRRYCYSHATHCQLVPVPLQRLLYFIQHLGLLPSQLIQQSLIHVDN